MAKKTKVYRPLAQASEIRKRMEALKSEMDINDGFFGGHMEESMPTINIPPHQSTIDTSCNTLIRSGRYSPNSHESTYGTHSAMIDIAAGIASSYRKAAQREHQAAPPDWDTAVNTNFFSDAGRVLITQKADVDKHFALAKGTEATGESKYRSAAVLKGDHVRIIGRSHIKIVTGQGQVDGGEPNSAGGKMRKSSGRIDLIAGNYTEPESPFNLSFAGKKFSGSVEKLQPVPKGSNLVEYLKAVSDRLSDISDILLDHNLKIGELATYLSLHFHEAVVPGPSPFPFIALPSAIGPAALSANIPARNLNTMRKMYTLNMQLGFMEANYLQIVGSPKYINSKFVNTT